MELDKCGELDSKKKPGWQKGSRKKKGKPMKIPKAKKNRKVPAAVIESNVRECNSLEMKDEIAGEDTNGIKVEVIAGPSRQTRNKPRKNYSDEQEIFSDSESEKAGESNDGGSLEWCDESSDAKNGNVETGTLSTLVHQNIKVEKTGPKRTRKEKNEPNSKWFSCDICSKSFKNKESFRRHVRRHEDPDALLGCPHCEFKTLQKSTWVQHLAVIHKEDPHGNRLSDDMKCNMCSFSCVTKYQLKAHVVRKHGDKPFKCNECTYQSSSKSDIEKHIGIRHRKERLNLCHICGFCSQTKGGYNRHVRSHEKVKPFYCTICAKRYADSPKLKSHLLRHVSDEKRFVCQYCGHSCRRLDNLQMHLRRIHKTTTTPDSARTYYQANQEISEQSSALPLVSTPPVQVQLELKGDQVLSNDCQAYAECIQDAVAMTFTLSHQTKI